MSSLLLSSFGLCTFFGPQKRMDIRGDAALRDGSLRKNLGQFVVTVNCELQMARHDRLFLLLVGTLARQLQNFARQIFENCCQKDRSTRAGLLSITTLFQLAKSATYGENEAGTSRLGSFSLASRFALPGSVVVWGVVRLSHGAGGWHLFSCFLASF